MTANRDLKDRVRDRQARTGESYTTALRHVLAQRPGSLPSAIPTVEFVDVTAIGAALGLKCHTTMSPVLVHAIDVERTLRRFRDMLVATQRDPALSLLRMFALQGEQLPVELTPGIYEGAVRFLKRVHAGLGGVSDSGFMLALTTVARAAPGDDARASEPPALAVPDERMAVFSPQWMPAGIPMKRPPLLVISSPGELFGGLIPDRLLKELP